MRFQLRPGTCGATAIVNVLKFYGFNFSENSIIPLSDTTKEGTDDTGIKDALNALQLKHIEITTAKTKEFKAFLDIQLRIGYPIILCFDNWQHWVTLIGVTGNRYIIIDSTNTAKNIKENGVWVYSFRQLIKRSRHKTDKTFYGIAVIK